MIECFQTPSFAVSLPREIILQIFQELIIAYKKDALQTARFPKFVVHQKVIALVSRNINGQFYQVILDAICDQPDCWDCFEVTIDEFSKNRKFDQIIDQCNQCLEKNRILPPLIVSICFNQLNFMPDHIYQFKKTLVPFFTHLKRLRFVGVYISNKISLSSFQNALTEFSYLTAIDAEDSQKPTSNKTNSLSQFFSPFSFTIPIPKKLLLSLEESSLLHQRLQSLTLNFNYQYQEHGIQLIMPDFDNIGSSLDLITADSLCNMLLKFSNLKKIGLINANLQPEDSSKLEPVLSKFSKIIKHLDFTKNKKINNCFLEEAFSQSSYNALEVLDVKGTKINQNCQIYSKCKNLTLLEELDNISSDPYSKYVLND